jgi:hypothetical protein
MSVDERAGTAESDDFATVRAAQKKIFLSGLSRVENLFDKGPVVATASRSTSESRETSPFIARLRNTEAAAENYCAISRRKRT